MKIRTYRSLDKAMVIRHIDRILREFGYAFSRSLDRDLLDIPKYYTKRGGRFWILADSNDKVVGTIGVSRINRFVCKLRRFYISRRYRHKGWGLQLYRKALDYIRRKGYREIWMSTTPHLKDSLRFQEKAGFKLSKKPLWPYKRASIFHILKLNSR